MLLGFVDTVMLGHYDTLAMAASVSANIWTFATLFFANGILFGLDPIIAQAHGAGDGPRAGLALQRGVVMALLLSFPVAASWLITGPFLSVTGQDTSLIPMAHTYAMTLIPSIPFFLVYSALRQYLQGRELVMPALIIVVIANAFNVIANWAFIFGHLGIPELGIRGAGIATSLTRIVSLLLLVLWVWIAKLHRGAWLPWGHRAFSRSGIARIFAVGLPVAIQTSTEGWAFSASTLMAGTLGATAVAAHAIALNLTGLAFMLPLGVSLGATTRVGNLIGAGVPRDAQRSAWIAIAMGASVMTLSATAFLLFRDEIPKIYTLDTTIIALATTILPIVAAFQIFDGTQAVACGVLRGMGRTRPAAVFNLIGYWVLGLPLAWWFGVRTADLTGIWWSLAFSLGVVASLLVAWIRIRGPASLATR